MFRYATTFLTFLLSFGLSVSAFSQEQTLKTQKAKYPKFDKTDFALDFSLGGFSFKEAQDESQLIQLNVTPKFNLGVTQDFGVKGEANLNLTSGRSQSRFQNPNFNFINIQEAVAYYEPATFFYIEAGAVDQGHFKNRLFIADRAFPGLQFKTGYKTGKWGFQPKAAYVIPSSTSFESDRTEAEELPTLTSFGVETFVKPLEWLKLTANVNSFEFAELPSVVAFNSGRFGNSVVGTDPSESFFRYQYKGFVQAYNFEIDYFSSLSQEFRIGLIENSEAPSDRRRSQVVGTDLSIKANQFVLKPGISLFYTESDAIPSLYGSFESGRANREGQAYRLELDLPKSGMKIKSSYIESNLIENRPLQADIQIFNLSLEFTDVIVL